MRFQTIRILTHLALAAQLAATVLWAGCGTSAYPYIDPDDPSDGGPDDADHDTGRPDADPDGPDADPDLDIVPDADEPPRDIADRLRLVAGMTVRETGWTPDGFRFFELAYRQPVDHRAPDGPSFEQHLSLLFRSTTAPFVLLSTGYDDYVRDLAVELTLMLGASQLVVEHRYFGASRPTPTDWRFLTIEQAAADHHRIVEALRPIFVGPWISTGGSKGGMTSVYHRRFFPDDVAGTVAYVAPISFGAPDRRYVPFVDSIGEPTCRERLVELQLEALTRRPAMVPRIEALRREQGLSFALVGGADGALEDAAISLPFLFWQYAGADFCPWVPLGPIGDQDLFDFLDGFVGFASSADDSVLRFLPYSYQAATELGFPEIRTDHVAHLLVAEGAGWDELLPGVAIAYDPTVMRDVAEWVATAGSELLFLYGEWDPWTAGAFDLGGARDSLRLTVPRGTHYAAIWDLPRRERDLVFEALERWTGVRPRPVSGPPLPIRRDRIRPPMLRPVPPLTRAGR